MFTFACYPLPRKLVRCSVIKSRKAELMLNAERMKERKSMTETACVDDIYSVLCMLYLHNVENIISAEENHRANIESPWTIVKGK